MKQLALDIGLPTGPSLDNFFPGPNAELALHLRRWLDTTSTVEGRAIGVVPTYLWGPPGSGKSHLLKALREGLRVHGLCCGWMDAQTLAEPEFQESWAAVLMDDVDQYSSEQLHVAFAWFVQAQALQRPMVASGSWAPVALTIRDDLRTRLGWGHVFALQLLIESERRSVLRQAADARGLFLSDDVMDYMLTRFSRDLGSLMTVLEHLDAFSLRTQRAITVPLLKAMMDDA